MGELLPVLNQNEPLRALGTDIRSIQLHFCHWCKTFLPPSTCPIQPQPFMDITCPKSPSWPPVELHQPPFNAHPLLLRPAWPWKGKGHHNTHVVVHGSAAMSSVNSAQSLSASWVLQLLVSVARWIDQRCLDMRVGGTPVASELW